MRRTIRLLPIIALAAILVGGCGSGSDRAQRMALAALNVTAPPLPASSSSSSSKVNSCGDVRASLRPPAVMPTPGAMPSGSFMATILSHGYLTAGVDQNTLLFAYFNPLDGQL